MRKRLFIDGAEWYIPNANAEEVTRLVREAMTEGRTVELELDDASGRAVTVFLNGTTAASVVVDLGRDPRPSEMS
ncbi:hypothetical protein [Asanoa siamensis]|uniref:Uncharacterized protein n=1 Tax=Asanoa siamensis TaxID=926357 RepID=A0ABQ4CP14_9ACTN|nr:hypothetical protein [Asanoa siamensis]GIF73002.1 hypothetical protein Asi02nite_25200 [Asanoa siamensis]